MRVVFMGTPAFVIGVLSSLQDAGQQVVGVYTQPDRPSGRGKRPTAPLVKRFSLERGLKVFQPTSLRAKGVHEEMASLSPDVVVVAAYGRILPSAILDVPPLGLLNIHPSLLPRYRGPSPVSSAILNGDELSGVTIMKLDEGMDTGPIVAQRETQIRPHENAESLTTRLFAMGAELVVEVLPRWQRGELTARAQDESGASVTALLSRKDGEIDWGQPADRLARQVRAYHPWPGTFAHWRGRLLKIIEASAEGTEAGTATPQGRVIALEDGGFAIGTGRGLLVVRKVQLEGRRPLDAQEFVRGNHDFVGSTVGR